MRHTSIQRAEDAYEGQLDLYNSIKKVEEILLSILLQMLRWSSKKDSGKVKEYAEKAISVYKKSFNETIFRIANITSEVMDIWFWDNRVWVGDKEIWKISKDDYDHIKASIEETFLYAKKAQLDVVMTKKAELEREMSPTWSFPEWYLKRLNKS